jgi:hypothetical protein
MLHFYLISRRILSQDHGIIRPLLHESFLENLRDPSGLIHVRSVFTYERIHVRSVFKCGAHLRTEHIDIRSAFIRAHLRTEYIVYLEHT